MTDGTLTLSCENANSWLQGGAVKGSWLCVMFDVFVLCVTNNCVRVTLCDLKTSWCPS